MKNVMLTTVLICIAGTASNAAVITWTGPTAVSDASDVSVTGTLIEAVNCYITANVSHVTTTSPTVNGVPFTGTMDFLNQDVASPTFDLYSGTTGDSGYDDLLSTVDFGDGGDYFTKSLGGGNLVPGTHYLIQIWYVDDRSTTAGRVMEYGDGNGNTVQLTAGDVTYATGTFTADGTTQALSFDAIDFGNAHLTAYQIREIDPTLPEVDAGSNWTTWSGQPVQLDDVTVVNNDPGAGALTLAWTAIAPAGGSVSFSDPSIAQPEITVTKPIDGTVATVDCTLTVTQPGKSPVESTMNIFVYDDACKASVALGYHVIQPGDVNADCVTDIEDLLEMVQVWLVDFALTGPVDK